ncbi:MAG: hypothetical protein WA376_05915, partial [Terrimicrobiaceae bacterium]
MVLEKLLTLLQSTSVARDRFASHLYQSRREYRRACETAGKSGKQIERCVIASFRIAESMGFKGAPMGGSAANRRLIADFFAACSIRDFVDVRHSETSSNRDHEDQADVSRGSNLLLELEPEAALGMRVERGPDERDAPRPLLD